MNPETLKKAVELADGFYFDGSGFPRISGEGELTDGWVFRAALAAQLVRQVDALPDIHVSTIPNGSEIWQRESGDYVRNLGGATGNDRTDNTINAIVESGVLEDETSRS